MAYTNKFTHLLINPKTVLELPLANSIDATDFLIFFKTPTDRLERIQPLKLAQEICEMCNNTPVAEMTYTTPENWDETYVE